MAYDYKTIDTSTLSGLRTAERLHVNGWETYRAGLHLVYLRKARAKPTYRVFANDRDFGIDYATLEEARAAKAKFAPQFPNVRYYIRKVG